ncbi:unnamed protein product [Schistosoma mattheei]|uniref:Uncharacterized protein n=1 Tax=Schistosoma mattheei TaxID=31246 RepID=A0A183PRF6_9TREM|nr:unnamed protein product [Schistosoma mattheei]
MSRWLLTQEKKRMKLKKNLDKQIPEMKFPSNPFQYVHNFSSVRLDKTWLEELSLGPKFYDFKKTVNKMDVEIQFENLYAQTTELVTSSKDNIERFKSTLVDCGFKYLNHRQNTKGISTKKHKEALRKRKTNDNLLITKPDKGHGIVFMDKNNYISKMKALSNDKTKFQKLAVKNDVAGKIEKQLTDSLKEIKQQGFITEKLFEMLKPTGTITPRVQDNNNNKNSDNKDFIQHYMFSTLWSARQHQGQNFQYKRQDNSVVRSLKFQNYYNHH